MTSTTGFCIFTQFAEPVTAPLADLSKLSRPLSAFTAFQSHFVPVFGAENISCLLRPDAEPYVLRNQERACLDRLDRDGTASSGCYQLHGKRPASAGRLRRKLMNGHAEQTMVISTVSETV